MNDHVLSGTIGVCMYKPELCYNRSRYNESWPVLSSTGSTDKCARHSSTPCYAWWVRCWYKIKWEVHWKVFRVLSQMVTVRGACEKLLWIYKRLNNCAASPPPPARRESDDVLVVKDVFYVTAIFGWGQGKVTYLLLIPDRLSNPWACLKGVEL